MFLGSMACVSLTLSLVGDVQGSFWRHLQICSPHSGLQHVVTAGSRWGPHGNSPTCLFSSEFVDVSSTVKLVKVSVTFQVDTYIYASTGVSNMVSLCGKLYLSILAQERRGMYRKKSQLMIWPSFLLNMTPENMDTKVLPFTFPNYRNYKCCSNSKYKC